MIHTVNGIGIVNKAEIDVLWNYFPLSDPADVGNLISGPSVFSKTSLNIWMYIFIYINILQQLKLITTFFSLRVPIKKLSKIL